MNTLVNELQLVKAIEVSITEDNLVVELEDGRILSIPLTWYPRLWHGKMAERQNWRMIGDGMGIHWPDLDEDISIEGLILGRRSGESQRSLNRWLEQRGKLSQSEKES
jgi:hypothetical protein